MLYALTGLFGREPWKGDDALHFGIALDFIQGGDWGVPHLAGEVHTDYPPLYHWCAAVLGKLLGTLLGLPDAVRLTSALFVGLYLWALQTAARTLQGPENAGLAPVLAIACIGSVVFLHDAQPLSAGLAGLALASLGAGGCLRSPYRYGAVLGAGLALSFMSVGLWLASAALCGFVPWLLFEARRNPAAPRGLAVAAMVSVTLALPWPLWLALKYPDVFSLWWQGQLGQVLSDLPDLAGNAADVSRTLLWFAWPALPIAGWALWRSRRHLQAPETLMPVALLLGVLVFIITHPVQRGLQVMPALVPLALLASQGAPSLRRGATNALDWFAVMTFSLFGGLIWVGWSAMMFGIPERLARQFSKLEPGFVLDFQPLAVGVALLFTAGWMGLLWRSPRSASRSSLRSAGGILLVWALVSSLWLPWINYGRSYRSLMVSMVAALPAQRGCVASRGLPDSQRAALDYFTGVETLTSRAALERCDFLITFNARRGVDPRLSSDWRLLWQGHRPGDRHEQFRLYTRRPLLGQLELRDQEDGALN